MNAIRRPLWRLRFRHWWNSPEARIDRAIVRDLIGTLLVLVGVYALVFLLLSFGV